MLNSNFFLGELIINDSFEDCLDDNYEKSQNERIYYQKFSMKLNTFY